MRAMLIFSACGGGGGGGSDDPGTPGGDKSISISVINGVTPPACGEIPVSIITANEQFTGTVSWSNSPSAFAADTVYTATIELTAKSGYTLEGVADNFFEVSGSSVVVNDADSGIITAEFPATGSAPPTIVNIKAISGITAPVRDAVPLTTITETAQYTGTIAWSGSPAKFAASTIYTATITLTAKTGYTFNGITANYFTLSGATSVANGANSGVITAVFPETGARDLTIETTTITFPSGTEFKIITTPDISTSNTFPCNINANGDYDEATDVAEVPARFIMGETEVTYQLWKEVYDWATSTERGSEKYTIPNGGAIGYGSSTTNQHPVTIVNWRDSIVWCNALTEYYNANNGSETDLVCVYTYSGAIIRDSGDSNATACDGAVQSTTAKGFRLPTSTEWEYAARYRGNDSTNTVSGYTNPYYMQGNSASGATVDYSNASATSAVAVYGVSSTAAVKTKTPNAFGLYDMSGNVYEWCFDWYPGYVGSRRVARGGGFGFTANYMQVGLVNYGYPYFKTVNAGFRICRNR